MKVFGTYPFGIIKYILRKKITSYLDRLDVFFEAAKMVYVIKEKFKKELRDHLYIRTFHIIFQSTIYV